MLRSEPKPIRRALVLAALLVAVAAGALAHPGAAGAALFTRESSFQSTAGGAPAPFVDPAGIATDDAGRVYVADSGAGRIEIYDSAADGNRYLGAIGGLTRPVGVATDVRFRIYATDAGRDVIARYDSFSEGGARLREEFGGPGTALGQLSNPRHIESDRASLMYVAERGNVRVQWFRPGKNVSAPVAGFGVAEPPTMVDPEGLARDAFGRFYISDDSSSDGEVRLYDPRGQLIGVVAGPGSGPGQVNSPHGVLIDPVGRVLVADSGNGRIQAFSPFPGSFLESYGSPGAGPNNLMNPSDVALAPGAMLYVVDNSNKRVVRLRYDDEDLDGQLDARDNCRGLRNTDQRDTDRDRQGNACDADDDNDGVTDNDDRCPVTRRGADGNGDGCGDPRSKVLHPRGGRSYRARKPPSRISGSASADRLGVDSVEVAVGRVNGSTCRWLDASGKLGNPKSCADPSFVNAQGTSRWSARMRLRGRGTWRVVSRAKQKETGLVERTTTPQNTRTFRLR